MYLHLFSKVLTTITQILYNPCLINATVNAVIHTMLAFLYILTLDYYLYNTFRLIDTLFISIISLHHAQCSLINWFYLQTVFVYERATCCMENIALKIAIIIINITITLHY